MRTITTQCTDRKAMVKAISEHLGIEAHYCGIPTYAYQIGGIIVERDGSINGEDVELEALEPFLQAQGYIATAEEQPEEISEAEQPVKQTSVSIPLHSFTPLNTINLLRTLYARQNLIAAMTQSDLIAIDEELVTRLADEQEHTQESVTAILRDEITVGMVSGIGFENDRLTIDFPHDEANPTAWTVYATLMFAIADRAKSAHHVSAKRIEAMEDELKYFCRNWLIQLGFGGEAHKDERHVLLDHLHGFAAFRSSDKMDAHRAKYAERRHAQHGEENQ